MKIKIYYVCLLATLLCANISLAQGRVWSKSNINGDNQEDLLKNLDSKHYSLFNLNINLIKKQLIDAPLRSVLEGRSNTIINFPNIDGKIQQFRVVETQTFSSNDNRSQHPNIKTYLGSAIDNSGTRVRFSITSLGLKGLISESGKKPVYIDKVSKTSNGQYLIYNEKAKLNPSEKLKCLTEDIKNTNKTISDDFLKTSNDQLLRTYRIAISVTDEFTSIYDDGNTANGDDRADALAEIVSLLNLINELYEVNLAITFLLVDTIDNPAIDIIYSGATNPDPYSGSPFDDRGTNRDLLTNLKNEVGIENFDLCHLIGVYPTAGGSGTGGSVLSIGAVCGDGIDDESSPTGVSNFSELSTLNDILQVIAHETGHQMGGNHTFSHINIGTGAHVEPGSGTTVMAYSGRTGGNDVQDANDFYFNYISRKEILNNVSGLSSNCGVTTAIINNPPVANAGLDYAIPNGTAFILKGNATDADADDILTYTWEQIDSGRTNSSIFSPTHTGGPTWRSRPPSINTDRYMPVYSRVLAGELTEENPTITQDNDSWETVSTVQHTLNFGLTVRDRSYAAIGSLSQIPQSDTDEMVVSVEAGDPFTVNTPLIWTSGNSANVIWNVGPTNNSTINCQMVNIKFSTDGGLTFPTTLVANTPNDGLEVITVPFVNNDSSGRILVEAADNIFYALSNNFDVFSSLSVNEFSLNGFAIYPNPNTGSFNVQLNNTLSSEIDIKVFDIRGRRIFDKRYENSNNFNEVVNIGTVQSGMYLLQVSNGEKTESRKIVVK